MTFDFLGERLAELIRINDRLNADLAAITRDFAQGWQIESIPPAPNGPRSTAPPVATTSASSPPATCAPCASAWPRPNSATPLIFGCHPPPALHLTPAPAHQPHRNQAAVGTPAW